MHIGNKKHSFILFDVVIEQKENNVYMLSKGVNTWCRDNSIILESKTISKVALFCTEP